VPGGQVALELGIGQADAVARMFEAHGYRDIEIQNDLAGIPRLFTARLQ
jgi:methylase of polypeptide subunit release factors